jgi:hypothetical protein
MANDIKIQENKKLMEGFLVSRTIPKEYKDDNPYGVPFGYIYCIENKTNHKKYIGSVYSTWTDVKNPNSLNQLRKRATNYIYDYNCARANPNNSNKCFRPIIKAMVDEGFDNFIMYPIAETNRNNHIGAENYFINLYDTINNGYNVLVAKNPKMVGAKLMAKDKLLRSEGVVCVNMNQKKIIFSDSMKLFGDYMNGSKDMIKNSCRKGRPYKGWFIFYIDENKRSYVLTHNVLGDGLPVNDRHGEKSKAFYKNLYGIISFYIRDFANNEYFPGFEVLPPLQYNDK